MTAYLSHKDRIEASLRYLESVGLDPKPLWLQHDDMLKSLDTETPSEFDCRYELPVDQPTIPEHFNGKMPQTLSAAHAWPGYSYTLTPGQRDWLRTHYGLTPTMTVTVLELTRWPGTRHPQMIHLKSDLHVDPRNRRHVLVNAVIRQPGRFFMESAARDADIEAEKLREQAGKESRGEVKKTSSLHKRTIDANDYLADLEAELGSKV